MSKVRPGVIGAIVVAVVVGLSVISLMALSVGPGVAPAAPGRTGTIGLLYIDGVIEGGQGAAGVFGRTSGSDRISALLSQAGRDPGISAVVIRLNSPGGTPAGSSEIAHAIARLRAIGIIVVASMSDMATSGAYWVAAATDEIIADPVTITGGIGAVMQVQNIEQLMAMLGIDTETFKSGEYKDLGSATRTLTDDERLILQSLVDDVHTQFVEAVATGRNLSADEVRDLDGRVFTGRQAVELGLVDTLGDLTTAFERAAELAGVEHYEVRMLDDSTWVERLMQFRVRTDDLIGSWIRILLYAPGFGP